MERMHKTVVALEMKRSSSYSTSRSNRHAATLSSLYPSPSMPVMLDDYVRLAAEIEASRRQNAAMAQELARHDTD
ncbi:hypothetical protein JG688_00008763 [Phytophthora aleatoria]|uniref:Uncharacterized protein n=1 Tax=Phytophthora aleatoria TaxID=2496075 RepID=A0A8J5IUJ3_9STRA|nr:hypothetical protein JG688_00008763 [Phytophthora aleatoria]